MEYENVILNRNLIILINNLKTYGIECSGIRNNSIEIFFDDNQKELILNMLSQIDSSKNGFIFKIAKKDNQKIKSVIVSFYRNLDLSCEFLNGYLDNDYLAHNLNAFNKLDIILDSFPYDNVTFTIQKNTQIKNGYLVTVNQNMPKEQMNGDENIVLNTDELKKRIIHTICLNNNDDSYNITYDLLYKDEEDLDNLLTIKNTNTNTKPKKLVKQLV